MFLPENLYTTLTLLQTLIIEERHDTDEILQRPSASSSKLLLYLFSSHLVSSFYFDASFLLVFESSVGFRFIPVIPVLFASN